MYRHKKKDHGIVDNGNTKRWCCIIYRGLYEMVVGGYLFDCEIEVLVVHKLDVL